VLLNTSVVSAPTLSVRSGFILSNRSTSKRPAGMYSSARPHPSPASTSVQLAALKFTHAVVGAGERLGAAVGAAVGAQQPQPVQSQLYCDSRFAQVLAELTATQASQV